MNRPALPANVVELNPSDSNRAAQGFHVLTKPIGPICNLDCRYCFYLEKEKLYPNESRWRMSDDVLAEYVRQYIQDQPGPEIHFAWQGGEPTLLGVEFFRKVVTLQQSFAGGKKISNALQTNGTLLDDEWCEFLASQHFLVGLSIDGPRELHDQYRVDKRQKPTFDAVMRGLELLKKHQVEFNTLTVVNRSNSQWPLEVYRFLKETGSGFIQFIPLVEREAASASAPEKFNFAAPPAPGWAGDSVVTPWSVEADTYGAFLCAIFDEWVRKDVGRVFVQLFDVALGNWMGLGSSLCVFAEKCGAAVAMEHNGDLYSCDHYVYPQYRLGNILNRSLGEMVRSEAQLRFGSDKFDALPAYCRKCEVRFACNGECPKHRFIRTPEGETGLNYLCAAYKCFFRHIDPHMRAMADLLRNGYAAADIMKLIVAGKPERPATGRNGPCPCGSRRKFKKCCGKV
ncbi:MAG TPA: anaerobic sulfatase maturase [Candidatus Paceibacterota bacterium]|nr:anaerobic sulfatase maturase [Candidatus Paceibacterota bacterium]